MPVMATIDRLSRLYPTEDMGEMVYLPPLAPDQLNSADAVDSWSKQLLTRLESNKNGGTHHYKVRVHEDREHKVYLPLVELVAHGIATQYRISKDFFSSSEYQSMVKLGEVLTGLIEEGAFVKRGDKQSPVKSFKDVLVWLMESSRKTYNIQRYKGLGEMNPDQLWDTTMNPETRRMIKVTVEDAIAADQIFTTLMGDQAEPRREFIETNALAVANLDV